MDSNIINGEAIKRLAGLKIAIGITAILAAIGWVIVIAQEIRFLTDTIGSFSFSLLWLVNYLHIIATIIAMIIIVIYIFVYYGKKWSPLFGVSAIILTVKSVYMLIITAIFTIQLYHQGRYYSENYGYMDTSASLLKYEYIQLILVIIIGLMFLLIALKCFGKLKANIKAVPIIALIAILFSHIFPHFILDSDSYRTNIFSVIADLLHIVPFILFILFCPSLHKRPKKVMATSPLQEQEAIMQDINSQLLYLKTQFENCKISQQEYDYKRKSLVDKL
jgi:hypothetical protein